MRAVLILAVLAALTGCDQRAQILEKQYARAATLRDKCDTSKQIAAIYLDRSDEKKYNYWSAISGVDCVAAAAGVS